MILEKKKQQTKNSYRNEYVWGTRDELTLMFEKNSGISSFSMNIG